MCGLNDARKVFCGCYMYNIYYMHTPPRCKKHAPNNIIINAQNFYFIFLFFCFTASYYGVISCIVNYIDMITP